MMKTIPHKSGWDFGLYKNKIGQRSPQKRKRKKREKKRKAKKRMAKLKNERKRKREKIY